MHADEQERREWLSALADGQLDTDELERTMAWVASSEEARTTWHAYHVVGDALRSADLADCGGDRAFMARLRVRLEHQQDAAGPAGMPSLAAASVAVAASERLHATPATAPVVADARVGSANDATLRWKWLAAAASVVAVVVLGWQVGSVVTSGSSTQLAQVPAAGQPVAGAAAAEPPVMLRDPRLDELLAAHRRFGGASALQMPAGFLRNATFEQPGR